MKLTHLLQRLSPEERTELIERRIRDESVPYDNEALARMLDNPRDVTAALLEVNAFQHLVIRWLVEKPQLKAPWQDLHQELDGRVPEEYLDAQLRDLRLWGLLDFDPSPAGGSVSTYSTVATAVSRDIIRLRDIVPLLPFDALQKMCRATGHGRPPKSKHECGHLLAGTLGTPAMASHLVSSLSDSARKLFEWVRDEGGRVSPQAMASRLAESSDDEHVAYMSVTVITSRNGPLSELVTRCLLAPVFMHRDYSVWSSPTLFAVPQEVEQALAQGSIFHGAQLLPPRLASADDVDGPGFALPSFMRDLMHLLGFIDSGQCEWRQDYQPYERSLKRFGKLIGAADPEYPNLLWTMARRAGLVGHNRDGRGYLPDLPQPLGQTQLLIALLDGLSSQYAMDFGPFAVVHANNRTVRFLRALQMVPADTWITKDSFHEFLVFAWPALFRRSRRSNDADWQEDVWEWAVHLVVETGRTAEGRDVFRVPLAMQKFLTGEKEELDELLPPWEESWIVQADRSVTAPPNVHPVALLELWRLTELESNAGASVFRVTRQSVVRALNRGMRADEALRILREHSKTPLPPTVEGVINDEGSRYGKLRVGDATAFIQSDDPALLETVITERGLGSLRWRSLAPGVACVDGVGASELLEMLRKAGHLPVFHAGQNGNGRHPLPQRQTVRTGRRRGRRA